PDELVLTNGRVYTLDEAKPWAEAIAIRGDSIVAVGTNAEARAAVGDLATTIDLEGAFTLPGFNDAHVHVDSTGALLLGVNLLDVHEPALFTERIAGAAGRMPEGSWITRGEWGAYEQRGTGSVGGGGWRGWDDRPVHPPSRPDRCRYTQSPGAREPFRRQ